MKVEVKNIDYVWHAFMPDGVLRSAGIADIVKQVEQAWRSVPKGFEIRWEARSDKFIVREVESTTKKLGKSNG